MATEKAEKIIDKLTEEWKREGYSEEAISLGRKTARNYSLVLDMDHPDAEELVERHADEWMEGVGREDR